MVDEEAVLDECRICREAAGVLLRPCRCSTPVHAACLRRWVSQRAAALFPLLQRRAPTCEVCLTQYDPLPEEFQHKDAWCSRADRICEYLVTLEGCLLLFLFVLALMGHALFLLSMYGGVHVEQFAIERLALGIANAILTGCLLVLVQRVVSRWLRESDFLLAVAAAPLPDEASLQSTQGADDDMLSTQREFGLSSHAHSSGNVSRRSSRSVLGHVILGASLSVVAACEVFLLMHTGKIL